MQSGNFTKAFGNVIILVVVYKNVVKEKCMNRIEYSRTITRWSMTEIRCVGPVEGNPFTDCWIRGIFTGKEESVTVEGFYDGDGIYCVRFMPSFEGTYSFLLQSNFSMQEYEGTFLVTKQEKNNHGLVRVHNTYHFAYEDGTPYYSIGTTCYVWELQSEEQIEQTLKVLSESAFNKIRFCIFPKHYAYNLGEPRDYPYEGTPMDSSVLTVENFNEYNGKAAGNDWDLYRFNPAYFRHIESCIVRLQELGIEADLILMHPYDRWGFSCMEAAANDHYLTYITARFSAYRNVWWSLANEYDLLTAKNLKDWEHYAELICQKDPYQHLRSIHNCIHFYDHTRPWITHCSIQRQDLYKTAELTNEWRERYKKPVVLDEIAYEGNIQYGWGNITAQEMVRRFWEAVCRGGYAGHGETFLNEKDILWWSHGSQLLGESHKRFRFLHDIMLEVPGTGLRRYERTAWDEVCAVPEEIGKGDSFFLFYYSFMQPSFREFDLPSEKEYEVFVLDTWNMTKECVGRKKGKFKVALPGKQYMAVMLKEV